MADEPSDGSDKDRSGATVRDLKGPVLPGDTIPDTSGLYVPPRPLPEASHHRTLDLKSVRLSEHADPRRWLTERRLVRPPEPAAKRSTPWLALTGAALLLGVLAWALSHTWTSPSGPASRPAADASAVAPKAITSTTATRSATPAKPASHAASSGVEPSPTVEASALPTQRALRPRESAKKRKDPWLE